MECLFAGQREGELIFYAIHQFQNKLKLKIDEGLHFTAH